MPKNSLDSDQNGNVYNRKFEKHVVYGNKVSEPKNIRKIFHFVIFRTSASKISKKSCFSTETGLGLGTRSSKGRFGSNDLQKKFINSSR